MAADLGLLTGRARALWNDVVEVFNPLGFSVVPTSTGRSAAHNATIPGASGGSQHIGGNAFDFQVFDARGNRVDPLAVQSTLANSGLAYGQNIAEYGLGMNPRNHLSVTGYRSGGGVISGENLVARNGNYSANRPDPASALTANVRSAANNAIADALRTFGIDTVFGQGSAASTGDAVSGALSGLGTALKAPGEALTGFAESWVLRGAIAVVAILLLGAAIFSMTKSNPVSMVKSAIT